MNPRAILLVLVCLMLCIPGALAAPYAQLELANPQTFRQMTVEEITVIDLMDLGQSKVTLHPTNGSDLKYLDLPRIHTVLRNFSAPSADINGNILTVFTPNSTVSLSGFTQYPVYIQSHFPTVQVQAPGLNGDIFIARAKGTLVPFEISSFFKNTDRLYILHPEDGAVGLEIFPNGTIGKKILINVNPDDFNQTNLPYTLKQNENPLSDYLFDWYIARQLTGSSIVPMKSGQYSLEAFQYDPGLNRTSIYALWPIVVMDGDNPVLIDGHTRTCTYSQASPHNVPVTFTDPSAVVNISYVLIKQDEDYDAVVEVNMTALEEAGQEFLPDALMSGNFLLSILQNPVHASSEVSKVLNYSIFLQGYPKPPRPAHPWQIAITPGYGTSGLANRSSQVTIPAGDLQALVPGTFSLYALGLDADNTITALDQGTITITRPTLAADFTANVTSGYAPLHVRFTDLSTGGPDTWFWEFGDATTAAVQNPVHVYTAPGCYPVNLTVRNTTFGGMDSLVKSCYINVSALPPVPVAGFTAYPTTGDAPLSVQFTDASSGNPSAWTWDFGDGSPNATVPSPGHTYLAPGAYDVTLTVSNAAGSNTLRKVRFITVTQPALVADFTGSPTSGFAPQFVQFTDTSIGVHDSWTWSFGDAGTANTPNPGHIYQSPGTYTVGLTVRDTMSGNTSTRVKQGYITIFPVPPAPVAQFIGSPTSGDAPLTVQFTDLSSGSPREWNWSFGDGGTSTVQNPVHIYQGPGYYTVSLTVRGLGGFDTETKGNYIHAIAYPPIADFIANITTGDAPLPVQFSDLSTRGPTSWSWSFGDGGASPQKNPLYIYSMPGVYTVSLTVSNAQGSDTRVRTGYINVTGEVPPERRLRADFAAAPLQGYAPLPVQFSDASTGNPISWQWTFGDGENSTDQNPLHTYRTSGAFTVSLTVSNGTADDTLTRQSYITVNRRGGGGGGGGGGSSGGYFVTGTTATPTATATPTPTALPAGQIPLGPDNRTTQPVTIGSSDGIATLFLGTGVLVTGANGTPLHELTILPVAGNMPPLPTDGSAFTGFAYRIVPEDALFDPAGTLTLTFSEDQWKGLSGKDLVLMWYDPSTGSWAALDTLVNEAARSVTAQVTHGGIYGLFVKPATPTPVETAASATTTPAPAPGLQGLWFVPVLVVAIAAAAAVAYYLFRIRPRQGNQNRNEDIFEK